MSPRPTTRGTLSRAAVAVAVLVLAGCGVPVLPAGPSTTRQVGLPEGIRGVRLEDRGTVELRTGEESLQLVGGRALVDRVRVTAADGTLVLGLRDGAVRRRGHLTYRLTLPRWETLEVHGSGEVEARGPGSDGDGPLQVVVHGSGHVVLQDASVAELGVRIHGSGDVEASGRATREHVLVSGSGSFDGSRLEGREVEVVVSGSGSAEVLATERLDALVSGSGDVVYSGDPGDVRSRVEGSGEVRKG